MVGCPRPHRRNLVGAKKAGERTTRPDTMPTNLDEAVFVCSCNFHADYGESAEVGMVADVLKECNSKLTTDAIYNSIIRLVSTGALLMDKKDGEHLIVPPCSFVPSTNQITGGLLLDIVHDAISNAPEGRSLPAEEITERWAPGHSLK